MNEEPRKPQSWWQTLPGIMTAVAGIITAVTGLVIALTQAGVFTSEVKTVSPSTEMRTSNSSAQTYETSTVDEKEVGQLEQKLKDINIELGPTAADVLKVRGYFASTNPAYRPAGRRLPAAYGGFTIERNRLSRCN